MSMRRAMAGGEMFRSKWCAAQTVQLGRVPAATFQSLRQRHRSGLWAASFFHVFEDQALLSPISSCRSCSLLSSELK